jgi:DNA polymerase-3 subunit delta'
LINTPKLKFSEVTGQEKIIERLRQAVTSQRVSHALMLAGPEGNGKLALALAFAQFVSCEKRSGDDSCGICPSCSKYEKLIHPDLHFVYPVFKKSKTTDPVSEHFLPEWRTMVHKTPWFSLSQWLSHIGVENEQGLIYASEAAEIIKKMNLKSYESDYKIMIIWLPEKMHNVTANKLLKMIEEPPEKTIFLLVSEEPDLILPTIMSRCQFIRVPAIEREALSRALSAKYDLPAMKADAIARSSRGNFVKAMNLVEQDEERVKNLSRFIALMRLAYKRDVVALSDWVEEVAGAGREAQKRFLNFSLLQIRENLVMNITEAMPDVLNMAPDEAEFAAKFSNFITPANAPDIAGELTAPHYHISSNGNARIILFDLALKLVRLLRTV